MKTISLIALVAFCLVHASIASQCEVALGGGGMYDKNSQGQYATSSKDSALYSVGYGIFLKRTNFRNKIEAEVMSYVAAHPEKFNRAHLRILDVGCGNGEMTKRYVNAIKSTYPAVDIGVDLVEPARDSLTLAARAVKSLDAHFEVREYGVKAEEFIKTNEFSYDLIIASHVFYHLDFNIIPNLTGHLSNTGALMISMGAPNHPLRRDPILKELSKHGDSSAVASVLADLASHGSISVETHMVTTDLDLRGLWNSDQSLTDDGKAYFSFAYNRNIDDFSSSARAALNQLLLQIEASQQGIIHPNHNVFWVCRK